MHTTWSHDCAVEPADLLDHAEANGLGAIAVTDHNVFGGALEAVELARDRDLIVIPGEEVKTDDQGEVIGLFLSEEIPRGMSFADTIAAIKEQGGLVYLPHPFDRMHAIPDAGDAAPPPRARSTSSRSTTRGSSSRRYNDEALRFARKYNLTMGAGSDAHVLQGVGTGALRMRAFDGPEEFLLSLRTAEVLRRPKSLAYLQSPQVGGPGQGTSPLGARSRTRAAVPAVSTDEIYERYLQKAITEINELGHEIAAAAAATRVPVLGSGHPLADVFLLKYRAAAGGGPGGRRLLRPRRPGDPEVAAAAARRPDGGLRDELPQVRRRADERGAPVARARAAHRPAEARRRRWASDALAFVNALDFPLSDAARARPGELQRFTPTIEALVVPGHRHLARRAAREDRVLERVQGRSAPGGPSCRRTEPAAHRRARGLSRRSRVYYAVARAAVGASALWWDVAFSRWSSSRPCFALVWLAAAARGTRRWRCSSRRRRSSCSRSASTFARARRPANFAKLVAVDAASASGS